MSKLYRMYRGRMTGTGPGSGFYKGNTNDFSPTARTFNARTQQEATRKMDRFIRNADIHGSFFVKEVPANG